jgi:hypothetical protein
MVSISPGDRREIEGEVTHCEVVRERASWKDTTLSDADGTVHVGSTVHEQAMEVQTGGLIPQGVLDINNNLIAFSSNDRWNGPLVVNSNHRACLLAIGVCVGPTYVEVICDGCAVSD